MYNVSSTVVNLLSRPYRQIVEITFNGTQGSTTLTESDIILDSFTIDRYSCSGQRLEIGSAIASELKFKLNNRNGAFNNTVFEGAELYVRVGVKNWDSGSTTYWIPCGYFTVDEPPRKLNTISISALDRMMKFDREVNATQLNFPMRVYDLVNRCCTLCGVTLASGGLSSSLPNYNYQITAMPETQQAITYRTLIQWAAQITGTCAFIDWDGKLRFQWYTSANYTVTPSMRYSSDLLEQDVTITGISFTDEEKTAYSAGTSDYTFDLTGNLLIQNTPQNVVNALYTALGGFTYRPFTATVKPAPYLYPMDKITFTDKQGTNHTTIVTNVNYKLNGTTAIAGTGETAQANGYATNGGLTVAQAAILDRMKHQTDEVIASREQATLDLNEIMANSLGLYRTLVEENGSVKYYFHDAATLADSTVIYTLTAGGFATTDDWNDGNPTWHYGMSRDGNAVVNALSAYKITSDLIDTGAVTADKIATEVFSQYVTNGQLTTALSATEQGILATVSQTYETQADLVTTLGSYYTKTETDSQISQSASDILLSVSSTYATQTEVGNVRDMTITTDTLHYLATSASSGVTVNTSGWTTTAQSVTSVNKYLWTYHTYTYGDSHTSNTNPVITGVYGDKGDTGATGPTGPQGSTGTSIVEVIPLYYASSSSSAPSAPTSNVTRTATTAGYWTRSIPVVSSSYPYLYTCDQVKYSNNTYTWTTVVKDNAISDLSTRMNSAELKITDSAIISTVTATTAGQTAVNSLIDQRADSIRMQAATIEWSSTYSSMSADGHLSCQSASVTGSFYSEDNYYVRIEDGIITGGKTNVIGYDNFIDFRGVFGYGDGPYIKGDNITFEGDIKVIDNYTIYTGYSGAVKIPTSIRSDGTVATWINISFVNGLLVN